MNMNIKLKCNNSQNSIKYKAADCTTVISKGKVCKFIVSPSVLLSSKIVKTLICLSLKSWYIPSWIFQMSDTHTLQTHMVSIYICK